MREFMMQHRLLVVATFIGLMVLAAVLTVVICLIIRRKDPLGEEIQERKNKKMEKVTEARRVVAPDGINPNPMSYTIIHDAGHDIYVRSFTIDTLPKRTVFAATFPALFNFDRTTKIGRAHV